jgi:glycosyltransferase involved in cell wall biosynthesis
VTASHAGASADGGAAARDDSAAPATVAVVIPALDEESTIAPVLLDLDAVSRRDSGAGFRLTEVVVVDNGSTDRTADVARHCGATVVCEPRRGYGAACLAGLRHLRQHPPRVVVFVDGDGSDDVRELPDLLQPLLEGRADLAIGSRTLGEREPGALTPVQRFGNGLAVFLMRLGFGYRATDLGPFRAIRWSALERLGMRDRDYGWTVEMQARAFVHGLRYVEVPVRYRRRRSGRSKVSGTVRGIWGAGWKILFTIARVRLRG